MNSVPVLSGQTVQNRVREIGINPNYWYAVAWAKDVKPQAILPIQIWHQEIALYRDRQGQIQAVEDSCPHKGVAIHKGEVKGDRIVCRYHGWEFDTTGACAHIPYFPPTQKLPRACLRCYPVRERYGLIFVFPGDPALAAITPLLEIPQYDDPHWLMIAIGAEFHAHFTICNENTMDVFHGYLHKNIQGWFDPILLKLEESESSVTADYQVSYASPLTKILGLSDHGGPTTRIISVTYDYPNYINSLQGTSYIYLLRSPISHNESKSFTLFFLKVRIPRLVLDPLRPWIEPLIREQLFRRFLRQDIEMIESESANYEKNPTRRYVEVNPAIIAVQRLMLKQYDRATAATTAVTTAATTNSSTDRPQALPSDDLAINQNKDTNITNQKILN
jgi:renierapurpurin 18,18'-hydroxylase